MAYIDINTKSYPSDFTSFYTKGATVLDGKYRVNYISDLWTEVPAKFYKEVGGRLIDQIAEGQQVYITNGTNWQETPTENHKGEIWVLTDKTKISTPIFEYNSETGEEIKTEGPHGWKKLGGDTKVNLTWENL